jgi:succinylglutamic semialdehyde dehydrogenase
MANEGLCIGGVWLSGLGLPMQSISPINGEVIWQGNEASQAQLDAAVMAARDAFSLWQETTLDERISILNKFAEALVQEKEAIGKLIAQETGKPLWDALGEVGAAAAKVAISIKSYNERTGVKTSENAGVRANLEHRPHGVLSIFGPYNFPLHLPNGHMVPALLAGNTIVYKPSELTPKTAEFIVGLWQKIGLPDGVLNLVQGGGGVGKMLVDHSDINGVLFTGSVPTGKAISKALATRLDVICALELGGNNPLIIGSVDNLEAAALVTIQSAYISSGQRCTCARRLIVKNDERGDIFLASLMAMMGRIQIGNPLADPQPFMGPLISEKAAGDVLKTQSEMIANGAVPLKAAVQLAQGPAYVSPALIDVTSLANRGDEECFGPLLQVIRVANMDEALYEANNTSFGLAAGLLSDDMSEYLAFKNTITAGIVNWNKPLTGASSAAPFGGVGDSGNHRPSAYYAADYCAFPVASLEDVENKLIEQSLPQGILP